MRRDIKVMKGRIRIMGKILLPLLVLFLLIGLIIPVYAGSGEVIMPFSVDLGNCGQEFFNYHNGSNVSDCLKCTCCCDNEYGCMEWSKAWEGEYPRIINWFGESTRNKFLFTYADSSSDYSKAWINTTNSASGSDITYLTVMMWGDAYDAARSVVDFSDGTTINIPGYADNFWNYIVAEFYFTEDNVVAYRNGEKYAEKTISHGANIKKITLETYYYASYTRRGLFDVFSTVPFPVDVPHELPNTDTEVVIAYIISHTHLPEYSLSGHTYTLTIKHMGSGEIVNVTNLNKRADRIKYNFTELGLTYDTYLVELQKDDATVGTSWFVYYDTTSGCTVNVERDIYTPLETAKITYSIANPDFSNHQYFLVIESVYDGEEVFRLPLSKAEGEVNVELEDYDPSLYIASLKRSSSSEILLAYDTFQVSEGVFIEGETYDAKSEEILPSVFVSYCQEYVGCKNTTSDAVNAIYQIKNLAVDYEIQVNASKTNYIHNDFSFTPLQNGLYNIDLFLLPDENHINITPPAIVGLVQAYPFYQNISEATVNLWNTSIGLATNNTTNSMGYFEFTLDNTSMEISNVVNETFNSSEYDTWVCLANSGIAPYTEKVTNTTDETPYERGTDYEMDYVAGKIKVLSGGNMSNNTDYHIDYEKYEATTFTINATKFKYEQMNQPQTFTVNGTEIKYIYLLMNPIYNLTVRARSADTHATIMEFNTILNDGNVVQTTTGYINFSVNYGIHKVEVSADGYYSSVSYVYVAQDTEKIMYLTPLEEAGGAGTYYPPPHLVEFKVQNVWGQPLAGVNVTAVPSETSMVNWSWIQSVYGYGENITQTMTGITDSNGAVSFVMVETVKYKMYFTNESQNISAYREIYPKDDRYTITIGEIPEEKIGWWLSTAQNDTANTGNITIHYLDYNEPVKTQWVNFSIYYLENDTLVYSHNFTTVNATNENTSIDLNASYTYKVKITAYHEDYGIISSTTIIVFVIPEKPKLPVAQELFKHLESWQITLISMFVLICFGFIFGAVSAGTGGLIVAAMAAAFYYFGLLPSLSKEVASIVIPFMLIVAVVNKLIEQRGVVQE